MATSAWDEEYDDDPNSYIDEEEEEAASCPLCLEELVSSNTHTWKWNNNGYCCEWNGRSTIALW
jgi:hypothetical protein